MGWWIQDEQGNSLQTEGDLIWGDEPADLMDTFLIAIDEAFQRNQGRTATFEEVQAGLLFSARVHFALPEGE